MTLPYSQPQSIERWLRAWELKLYPSLKRVPLVERSHALRTARAVELDTAERAGVVASVAITAYLLQFALDDSLDLVAASMIQFLLAWPLLAILVAPWLVRRTRRGLQREAGRFEGGDPCPVSLDPTQVKTTQRHPSLAWRRRS